MWHFSSINLTIPKLAFRGRRCQFLTDITKFQLLESEKDEMDAPLETAKLKIEETVSAIPIETASTEPEEAQPRSQVQN